MTHLLPNRVHVIAPLAAASTQFLKASQSLTVKLTATLTTVVIVVVSGVTLLSIQREKESFQTALIEESSAILDTLEVSIRDPLYTLDADFIDDLMAALGKNQGLLASGRVYDVQGQVLADAFDPDRRFSLARDSFGRKLVTSDPVIVEWQSDRLMVGRTVVIGNQTIGAISIGLWTASLDQKIAEMRMQGLKSAAFFVALSMGLALLSSRSIVKPIQHLVKATEAISEGDFAPVVRVDTNDEISQLANAFNSMSDKLQHTLTLLSEQNETLETRVKERTLELSQALQNLQETQTQLVQSEKMSSLGQMVSGIAHEINNPINFIQGNLEPLRNYFQDLLSLLEAYQTEYPQPTEIILEQQDEIELDFILEDSAKLLSSMKMGTQRVRDIVVSLRNYSRLDEAAVKDVDIHEGLDSTLLILNHRIKDGVDVIKDYGDLPQIRCSPSQLNQVFTNIIANALDAMFEVNSNPMQLVIKTRVSSADQVQIHIRDTGPGMTPELKAKIFDPFFTTKVVGKGTGLGMGICFKIIEQHQGKIDVISEVGKGSEVIITLPITPATK